MIGHSAEEASARLGDKSYAYPWDLETICNELLVVPKNVGKLRSGRTLRNDQFAVIAVLCNAVRALENAEDGISLRRGDIFVEIHRSIQRQFEWQRGFSNLPRLYRSIFIYGSGRCAEHFTATSGINPDDFMKIGFSLYALALSNPIIASDVDLSSIGISTAMRDAAMKKLSIGLRDARVEAKKRRSGKGHTAYRASLLRDFPIIGYGHGACYLTAPLPPLIMQRITSGLYLDVVDGGTDIWAEIGRRFEVYCVEYLRRSITEFDVQGESEYGPRTRRQKSPDVIIKREEMICGIMECKAKRMTLEARYSDDPIRDARKGYEEIAKGFVQIWRYIAHVRQGRVKASLHEECSLAIVTHDPWLAMATSLRAKVLGIATEMATRELDIVNQDRRPIAIIQIDDIEYCLQTGPQASFMANVRKIAAGDNSGWLLSSLHEQDGTDREYPFKRELEELLPWWGQSPRER